MTTDDTAITTPDTAYPGEDWAQGLYVDSRTPVTTMSTSWRDPASPPSAEMQVTEAHFVSAEEFMVVQKERDTYRRTLALINGWRMSPDRDEDRLRTLLASAGHNDGMGEAVLGILRWAAEERRTAQVGQ